MALAGADDRAIPDRCAATLEFINLSARKIGNAIADCTEPVEIFTPMLDYPCTATISRFVFFACGTGIPATDPAHCIIDKTHPLLIETTGVKVSWGLDEEMLLPGAPAIYGLDKELRVDSSLE